MKKTLWFLNRLSKMSFPEILYRVGHKFAEKQDKAWFRIAPPVYPRSPFLSLSPQFFDLQAVTSDELLKAQARLVIALGAMANGVLTNRLNIFGIYHDFGKKIDWHLDPKTGNRWPLAFWSEVDIRDGFKIGGPKFVWEVNRLYGLNILGMAYRLTGDEKYADKFFALLAEWLEANPYPYGVNWTSGIELGTRVANLIWGLSFLAGRKFSDTETELVNRFVWLHGRHLHRYPSKYSSNNNHAIAEAFALFLIGVFFPGFAESGKWRAFGQEVLDREGQRQILADGGSYEYTTTYLSFVFDFFLLYKLVCEKNGLPCAPAINDRLEHSCEFIHALMDEQGNVPNIGDQDSAVLVNFGLDNHENFQSILNTGAVLFNRPEFCRSNFPDFKTLALLGDMPRPTAEWNRQVEDQRKKRGGGRLFAESGLAVVRGEVGGREVVFVGNATPLGMPPLYAHGHLDALSFTLSAAGKDFLVDPGTYLYHSGGKWRRYFRSTAAHNTIRINETDMTEQVADFMFAKPYRITVHSLQEESGKLIWRAGHDAYLKLPVPVAHERQVAFAFAAGKIEIVDSLTGGGRFMVEMFFHFHPDCLVKLDRGTATIERGEDTLEISFDQRLEPKLFRGCHEPLLGWYSKAFNHLQETTTIVCRGQFDSDLELLTTMQLKF